LCTFNTTVEYYSTLEVNNRVKRTCADKKNLLLLLNYLLALGRAYIRVLGILISRRFLQQILEKTLQYEARDDIDKKIPLVEYTVIRKFFLLRGKKKDTLVQTFSVEKTDHPMLWSALCKPTSGASTGL
jgi:hypothetical protein